MGDPQFLTMLGLGFLLGARHALDPDHVAAVLTILSDRPSFRRSGLVGCSWGFGHTTVLLAVGLAVLQFKVTIPADVERAFEFGVGAMLLGLGGALVVTVVRERWHWHAHDHGLERHVHLHSHGVWPDHEHVHWWRLSRKPFLVGMVHGLAGSAALMLLVLTTAGSSWEGVVYILVFGAGSIIGMAALGALINVPLVLSAARDGRMLIAIRGLAGAGSAAFGLLIMLRHGLGVVLF